MNEKAKMVYDLINSKASSNQVMQGISGVLGFPFTLIADGAVIFTHYGPMLNQIRSIYGRSSISVDVISPVLKGCTSEILTDLLVDKIIGNIPVIGLAANIMCAKTMTWRLGLVFAMISARGEEINAESVRNATRLVRELFPQRNMFRFASPGISVVERLLEAMEDITVQDFDARVNRALAAL